jgi:hypothetical protein
MPEPPSSGIGDFVIGESPIGVVPVSFWPPQPLPGSNAFGDFTFGVSPFGTISLFNWLKTVISQYANSQVILHLLQSYDAAVNPTQFFDMFYDQIWNIATAQGYGLDVWGRIVGVVRNLQVSAGKYFGFEEGGDTDYDTFGPGGISPFYSGTPTTSNFALTDNAFRQLIMAKAAANICNGSIPAINQILMALFGASGECYCTDGQNMTMTYTFKFQPNPVQEAIIYESGVLPRSVGVAASVVISP